MISVEALAGTAVRYRLAPWVHGHAIRRIERYDESSEAGRYAARAELHVDHDKRLLAIILSPLLGHLPGPVQKKMEHDFGAPAVAMTIVSAFPLFVVGFVGLLAARITAFGGGAIVPEWMTEHQYLMVFLTAESAIRLVSAFIQGEPMGSLAGVLTYNAMAYLRKEPAQVAPSPAPMAIPKDQQLDDRYKLMEPLLALLSPQEQQQLELHFAFDPFRWGFRTSAVILWFAGANVAISILSFLNRTDVFLDFAAFVVGGYFILEQISRRRALAAGHPAGSILGFLVRPLARPLIEAARS